MFDGNYNKCLKRKRKENKCYNCVWNVSKTNKSENERLCEYRPKICLRIHTLNLMELKIGQPVQHRLTNF